METWVIQTGGQKWKVDAGGFFAAIKRAWRKRAPKSVGCLVEGVPSGDAERTTYCLGHVAVQKAGFKCEEPTLEEYLAVVLKA